MKVLWWANAGLCVMAAGLLTMSGVLYITEGYGLHPLLATAGVLASLGLGWLSACLADKEGL